MTGPAARHARRPDPASVHAVADALWTGWVMTLLLWLLLVEGPPPGSYLHF